MRVGDLVKHERTKVIGIIVEIDLASPAALGGLFTVQWSDEMFSKGPHWSDELKVINSKK